MIEPLNVSQATDEQSIAPPETERRSSTVVIPVRPTRVDSADAACLMLARTGTWVGWGLVVLGAVAGLERVTTLAVRGQAAAGDWLRSSLGALFSIVAYGLAGFALAVLARSAAAVIRDYLHRFAKMSDELVLLASRGATHLERIAQIAERIARILEQAGAMTPQSDRLRLDRAGSMSEIERAVRSSQWEQAQSLLRAFAAEFPNDPQQALLEAELHQARHDANQQHFAKLEAAREVNDPEGVLETYLILAGSLEADAKAALDRDLAKWFLALIHRRLRTTKIQPDVVQLASRFAETFASTLEGASVRAALPTLRRSVGLCPRCGSTYGGTGDACPKCRETIQLRSASPDPDVQVPHSR
jgi:hypothetical protein